MPNLHNQPAVITKNIGVPLRKSVEKTKKGSLIVSGYFTSDAPDMHGDIITRMATENATKVYRQWGNIRRMHAPDPVGKVVGIGVEDGLEWNEVKIEVIDPKAVFEVENGLLQALSIGALIKFEDITWLEDGGMLISDYLLGEISLVDHPANYDSFLKDENSARSAVNMLVRQYGLDNVSRGMLDLLKEKDMADEITKDVTVEDEITEETTIEADADNVEAEDAETTKEIIEETEEVTEEVVEEEEVPAESDIVDENEIVEEAETTEVVETSIDEPVVEPDRLERIENAITELTNLVKALTTKEAEVVEESIEEESIEEIQEDVVTEDATEEEVAIEQKTVIPADELPEETVEEKVVDDPRSSLRKALNARFGRN